MAKLNEVQKQKLNAIHDDLLEILVRLEDSQEDSQNNESNDWAKAIGLLISGTDRVHELLVK